MIPGRWGRQGGAGREGQPWLVLCFTAGPEIGGVDLEARREP